MEACGVVTAVGPGVTGRRVGDLVAYVGIPMGSYAEEQILPENKVVPVPPSIDPIVAASVLLGGMTAQVLLRQSFKVVTIFCFVNYVIYVSKKYNQLTNIGGQVVTKCFLNVKFHYLNMVDSVLEVVYKFQCCCFCCLI